MPETPEETPSATPPTAILYGQPPNQTWRNVTIIEPVDTSGYEPTGVTEEIVYKGVIKTPENPGFGSLVQTQTRWQTDTDPAPGLGWGTKTITKTYYQKASEEDPEGNTAASLGQSENNASITINATLVTKSILLHPVVAEVMKSGGAKAAALKMLAQGAIPQDMMYDPDQGARVTIQSVAGDGEAAQLVMAASEYYDVQYNATLTWQVDSAHITKADLGLRIKNPPGIGNIGKRNWLYTGTSYRSQGGKFLATSTYILSGPDGWDPKIYGNS